MLDTDLFQMALGLAPPWTVSRSHFDVDGKRLDVFLDFPRGSTFACPTCATDGCVAYDTAETSWRHLNFFQHEAHLHARVPRVTCKTCGVHRVNVPWARAGSGFTLLFEALVMSMVRAMPVKTVADMIGEEDKKLWRVVHYYVERARAKADHSKVTRVAFDETAARRGHDYVTIFVDLDRHRALFATEGKDAATVAAFGEDLSAHGGKAEAVTEACMDMSAAFIAGTQTSLPNAKITYDKFHVIKIINEAVDKVRREEQKSRSELKKSRYLWLTNPNNLSDSQTLKLESLSSTNLKTARAYQIRLSFQELYEQAQADAEPFMKKWYFWATHSRLQPMIEVARSVKRHWDGILRWFQTKIANGILEGINTSSRPPRPRPAATAPNAI